MSVRAPQDAGHRLFSKRRIVLLASVAGLGAGVLFGDFALTPNSTGGALFAPPYAHAQNAQRPVGFADIVEKVKPSVISVKVKMNAGGDNLAQNEDNPLRDAVRGFFPPFRSARRHSKPAGWRPARFCGRNGASTPWAKAPDFSSRLTAMR